MSVPACAAPRAEPHHGRVRIVWEMLDYSGARRPPCMVVVASMTAAQAEAVLRTLPAAIRQARTANDSEPVPARGPKRGRRRPAPEGAPA